MTQFSSIELELVAKAIQTYAETHPRPVSVTQRQAAVMLNVSNQTVCRMVKTNRIKLNALGQIPISEVDRVLTCA